ncbi:Uncharacterised protein [Bordetella pertussis]|nr:Uncharacterised protein [Bordetella pertussis]
MCNGCPSSRMVSSCAAASRNDDRSHCASQRDSGPSACAIRLAASGACWRPDRKA